MGIDRDKYAHGTTGHGRLTIAEARRRINAAELGRYDLDTEMGAWLHVLLSRHVNGAVKMMGGAAAYWIRPAVRGKGRSTWIERRDGTLEVWSWVKAARGKEQSPGAILNAAMRRAVEPSIQRWRNANPRPFDGELHVDHHGVPFAVLREEYLCMLPTPRVVGARDGIGVELHPDDAEAWVQYHDERATLRWLPAVVNMRNVQKISRHLINAYAE